MSDISTTLLTYLLQHRILDENSANKIKELIKQDSHKVIGEVLVENSFFTKEELFSRYEIWLENYYKTINIESNTLAEMIQKQVIPSVYTYVEKLADTAAAKKSVVADISVASEAALISKLSTLADTMAKDLETLKADTAKALASSDDVLACSKAYQETVLEDMETLRKSADEAEALIPDELLPYPTYDELLFSI